MQLANHFTILAYPFRHALTGPDRAARLAALDGFWAPWWRRRLDGQGLLHAVDEAGFFRPYLRRLLFPESEGLPADEKKLLAEAESRSRLAPAQLAALLSPDTMLRLTFPLERLHGNPAWQLVEERRVAGVVQEVRTAPFRLCWADVALFPPGVGILLLKVRLEEDRPTVTRLRDFLKALSPVLPLSVGWKLARWVRAGEGPGRSFENRDLLDFLLQGLTDRPASRAATLDDFLGLGVPDEDRYTACPFGQSYGQVFHFFSYACQAGPPPKVGTGVEDPSAGGGLCPFASETEQALYELATWSDTANPDWRPHRDFVARLREQNQIRLWENWQGLALNGHAAFLGHWESGFNLRRLAINIEGDYLHLFLLALFQRTRLSLMFGDLVRRERDLHRNRREARLLWRDFMMFQNHYWFNDVTPKPQGAELYRRFQQGLGLLPLFDEISREVTDLQEYYERRLERGVSSLLFILTFVGLPLNLLVQVFAPVLLEHGRSWATTSGLLTVAVTTLLLFFWWKSMQRE